MVKLISESKELDFLPADPFAARITALLETYGANQSFAMFWIQVIDDVPVAAVSKVDGNVTLCCSANSDFEEISCFINAVGFLSLTYDDKFSEQLGLVPQKKSFIVRYNGNAQVADDILRDYDKKEIYSLLCSCGFELGDYGAFLSDICSRLNKKTASLAAIEKNNELCACAFALFEGKKSVLLGAVATAEKARGNGYASKLVGSLAQLNCDKTVFLFCRNDGLVDFYSKIGFVTDGKWAVYNN